MKHYASISLTLLAAGWLITSHAQAQEKLFSAPIANKLPGDGHDVNGNTIIPLESQGATLGYLIGARQTSYTVTPSTQDVNGDGIVDSNDSNSSDYKSEDVLKILGANGAELKNLASVLSVVGDPSYNLDGYQSFSTGNGGFGLIISFTSNPTGNYYGYKSYTSLVCFSYTGTDWVETIRLKQDTSDKAGIQDLEYSPETAPASPAVAAFRTEGAAVMVDVYAFNKAALAPVAKITSDLSDLSLKRNKPMRTYAITTDFETTGFTAIGLPAGLVFNSGNGQISGKPTAKGYFSVVIGASRRGQAPVLATLNLRVR